MSRSAVLLATALFFLSCLAAPVSAAMPRQFPNDQSPPTFPGSSAHLPVGPGVDADAAIEWARNMASVRWALDRCARRGYLRHPERDAAALSSSPPVTTVVLALEKPGLADPPGLVGAPIVQVSTALDDSGNPVTQVSGGLVFFDLADNSMHLAENVPGFAADRSFDLQPSGGGGGGVYRTARIVSCLSDYVVCAGVGNAGCVGSALLPPRGWWSVASAAVCVAANTTRCVHGFAKCWNGD